MHRSASPVLARRSGSAIPGATRGLWLVGCCKIEAHATPCPQWRPRDTRRRARGWRERFEDCLHETLLFAFFFFSSEDYFRRSSNKWNQRNGMLSMIVGEPSKAGSLEVIREWRKEMIGGEGLQRGECSLAQGIQKHLYNRTAVCNYRPWPVCTRWVAQGYPACAI